MADLPPISINPVMIAHLKAELLLAMHREVATSRNAALRDLLAEVGPSKGAEAMLAVTAARVDSAAIAQAYRIADMDASHRRLLIECMWDVAGAPTETEPPALTPDEIAEAVRRAESQLGEGGGCLL